ncbi:MAG: hypothetical protein LBE21_01570 [Pseudomonadales bacterium]|jgi:hypothetical protein|nr:hypothetical protein [Pseudomonadales bacterium]
MLSRIKAIPIKLKLLSLLCALLLLSGCAELQHHKLESSVIGQSAAQLANTMRLRPSINPSGMEYYCLVCNGDPMRTYTNGAGNTVAVYFFRSGWDYSSYCEEDYYGVYCEGGYSQCFTAELRFELRNDIVINSETFVAEGNRVPLYTEPCGNYMAIDMPGDPYDDNY